MRTPLCEKLDIELPIFAPASQRISRAHKQDWHGSPAGQIVGRLNAVRPTKDVIFTMVEEWIEATGRLNQLIEE